MEQKDLQMLRSSRWSRDRIVWVGIFILGIITFSLITALSILARNQPTTSGIQGNFPEYNGTINGEIPIPTTLHLVYFGNSMIFKNDCPNLIEQMTIEASLKYHNGVPTNITQDTCLVGGASLTSLWYRHKKCNVLSEYVASNSNSKRSGNNDDDNNDDNQNDDSNNEDDSLQSTAKFIPNRYHNWDYVIMNDQSQGPARESTRLMSIETIKTKYAPLFLLNENQLAPIPIIIQTPAYRYRGVQDSEDIGSFDNFTDAVAEGVKEYQQSFNEVLLNSVQVKSSSSISSSGAIPGSVITDRSARIAPVGEAYRWLRRTTPELYKKLYEEDNFHPSLYGTWLQACVIFITCFHQRPPQFNSFWMNTLDPNVTAPDLPIPTDEEADVLRNAACVITGYC